MQQKNMETRTLHTEFYKSQSTQARGQVYYAPICDTQELTKVGTQRGSLNGALSRTYLHIEFGKENTEDSFKYESGDHIAVWPVNPYQEVEKLIKLFGWDDRELHATINIRSTVTVDGEPTIQIPCPASTRREILLTNCLDICGPVSQESITHLAHFAPTDSTKRKLENLINDKGSWVSQSASNF
jgi:sulfite reductase alpha subunit-like flavoprotein